MSLTETPHSVERRSEWGGGFVHDNGQHFNTGLGGIGCCERIGMFTSYDGVAWLSGQQINNSL
ncbi:hypothetical protein ACFVH0_32510 [Streptomyces sp. NPDC127117]|uniref:hypothetical protein n=1 Tax=Streptomyces sp. NPDC127117 TaxID=3345368 RepID=UPI00363C99AF